MFRDLSSVTSSAASEAASVPVFRARERTALASYNRRTSTRPCRRSTTFARHRRDRLGPLRPPGGPGAGVAGAARVVEAEYEWPFQSHASMGPACAVVDARADGATLWTGSQKPHYARDGAARVLGLPPDKVHGIWVPGPGSYGRNDAGDAGIDAALLSKAVGRPVRVQGMRWEGHGWDPKGPASVHRARAALDHDGAVIGYLFESKGFSRIDIDTNESDPSYSLAGQLMGLPLKSLQGFGVPAESYGFANKLLAWETVAPLLDRASPLRTAHLRDPVGPQILASAAKQSRALLWPCRSGLLRHLRLLAMTPWKLMSLPPRSAPTRLRSACAI